jgi:hypothetical protein
MFISVGIETSKQPLKDTKKSLQAPDAADN